MRAAHEVHLDRAALDIIYTLLTPHRDSSLWESRSNTTGPTLPPEEPCRLGADSPNPTVPTLLVLRG